MLVHYIIVLSIDITLVFSYNIRLFTITNYENASESQCGKNKGLPIQEVKRLKVTPDGQDDTGNGTNMTESMNFRFVTISIATPPDNDPLVGFEDTLNQILYGPKADQKTKPKNTMESGEVEDYLAHWPSGQVMRAEMFKNKTGAHLPFIEYVHRRHCRLKITKDYMQTALDAFVIFTSGDLEDVEHLPAAYVLQSARTIAMMKIRREKLAATWTVVKGNTSTDEVSYEILEKFRPLFKYINGKEMARLNLSDNRILSYIGTHPDLNRHQVGVVASKYIQLNPRWTEAKYLNMMNNLLCGVPMIFMRRIPENTYLQLTHQIFYHIRACDPLQRRFYLAMMMRTQALGKSYSWSAREVSRLGLLLAEVSGSDLSAVNPEAMSGITPQVMMEMPIHSLKAITEMQLRYLEPKPLNILARKLIAYQNQQLAATGSGGSHRISVALLIYIACILVLEITYDSS